MLIKVRLIYSWPVYGQVICSKSSAGRWEENGHRFRCCTVIRTVIFVCFVEITQFYANISSNGIK